MTVETGIVFGLLVVSLVLFAWERFSFDVTALIILSVLLISGIITPDEGLAGFSNRATVTIAAMFVLTEGLSRTGFLQVLGRWLGRVGRGEFWRTLVILMAAVGVVSAFINNTAAVAIFIPVVIGVSARAGISPSKLLIPMSFASMFGGVTTLIGTSTNLLVSSIAQDRGVGSFSMFDFTPVGAAFFALGFAYMLLLGVRLIPERRSAEDLTGSYGVGGFITDVKVEEGSSLVGRTVEESGLLQGLDLDLIALMRPDDDGEGGEPADGEQDGEGGDAGEARAQGEARQLEAREARTPGIELRPGDVLRVRGGADEIQRLLDRSGLVLRPARRWVDADLELGRGQLVEAVVAPESSITSRSLRDIRFREQFGATVLAIRHQGDVSREELTDRELAGGDSLLLLMDPEQEEAIREDPSFVVVSGRGVRERRGRMPVALGILAAVVGVAALGLAPIVLTAVVGSVALVLSGCVTMEEAYEAVNWKVIFLLAGVLPLGTAMEKTGAATLLAEQLLEMLGSVGPHAVLAGFIFITMALTAVVTNNATAVLLAPVALSAADSLGVDPWPLLMGVTYAASLSFVTPIGYQTNTLVYGPGGYRFTDYTRVGFILNLLFLGVGAWLIPVVFPF